AVFAFRQRMLRMVKVLFGLAILVALAGLGMVGFGIPINEFSLGNLLIGTGVTALVGGFVLLGIAVAVAQLGRIAELVRTRPSPPRAVPPRPVRPRPRPAPSLPRVRPARRSRARLRHARSRRPWKCRSSVRGRASRYARNRRRSRTNPRRSPSRRALRRGLRP